MDPKQVLEAAGHFMAYLSRDPMIEEVPAAATKREELVDGLDRNPNKETTSPEFDQWAEDHKFGPGPDVKFQSTEHDKS